jgi:hypothetical protein
MVLAGRDLRATLPLSPLGRGREAMSYGRVRDACCEHTINGATVTHSAELVRGNLFASMKAPSSALRAPSPQGEKGRALLSEYIHA